MRATLALLLATCLTAMAQEPEISGTGTGAGQGWNPYGAMTAAGVSFPVSYTGEVLGNPAGGHGQGVVYDGLLEAGVTIDLGKLANWEGAKLTVDGLYPHGSSLTRNDVRDFNVLSNIDTVHSPRLYEAWLEQEVDGGKFSIRAGQLPLDTEFCVSTNAALFLNSAFGAPPTLNTDLNVAVYPVAAPGARLRVTPDDAWSAQGGVFDGDVGDLHTTNRDGLRFNLNGRDGALAIGEVAYTVNPPPGAAAAGQRAPERPLSGTYKVGGFYDSSHFPLDATGGRHDGDYGLYFITDQELWHAPGAPDEGLRGFARLSWAPADRNRAGFYCDGGFNYQGLIPGRTADLLGLAVSYTKMSDDLLYAQGNPNRNHYETIVELTYQAVMTGWLNVQPDVQYIFNPGAVGAQPNALVLGLRFNMTF